MNPPTQPTSATARHTPERYRELTVKCYGSAESGPFAQLSDGSRVYGLPAAAPDLLAALEDIIRLTEISDVWLPKSWKNDARAALAKARAKGVQS